MLLFKYPGIFAGSSLTEMCSHLADQQVYLSKEALNKRLNEKTVCFLWEVFFCLFTLQANQSLGKLPLKTSWSFTSIRILDATSLKLSKACQSTFPGNVGAGVKIQLEFDYLTGRFHYVELQPGKSGDCPAGTARLQHIQPDELFLQDLGYFQFDILKRIAKEHAFYITRARSDTMFYLVPSSPELQRNGKTGKPAASQRLLIEETAKSLRRGQTVEFSAVYLGKHEKMPARLILYRMTEEEQKRQEHRIKRRRQTKPSEIKQKSLDLAGISMLVTNLPEEVPAGEVVALYRYRWQIELLFRSWKSDLRLNQYREMKPERWECHLYAELIVLLLSTLFASQLRVHFWQADRFLLSEQIAIREIAKKIGHLWHARDGTDWQSALRQIETTLIANGQKKWKEPGPIGWLA